MYDALTMATVYMKAGMWKIPWSTKILERLSYTKLSMTSDLSCTRHSVTVTNNDCAYDQQQPTSDAQDSQ